MEGYRKIELWCKVYECNDDIDYIWNDGEKEYENFYEGMEQRIQIMRGEECYGVDWHSELGKVVIQKGNENYFLEREDGESVKVIDVIKSLGYGENIIKLYWVFGGEGDIDNILASTVERVKVHQLMVEG